MTFTENYHPVSAIKPQAGGSAITGEYISLKGKNHVTVLAHINQGNAAPVTLSVEQAASVSGTGSKAITEAVPIFLVPDAATSDLWVRQPDGVSFTTDAAAKEKLVVFEIDVATLDVNNGFNCLAVKAGGGDAANVLSAVYIVSGERYQGKSVLTD